MERLLARVGAAPLHEYKGSGNDVAIFQYSSCYFHHTGVFETVFAGTCSREQRQHPLELVWVKHWQGERVDGDPQKSNTNGYIECKGPRSNYAVVGGPARKLGSQGLTTSREI